MFLFEVLVRALRHIPSSNAPWSWGEFYNGGVGPLFDMSREKDWPRLALCAADLGLAEQHPRLRNPDENLTPLNALDRNLGDGIDRLLAAVRERLEAAGFSPYGEQPPRSPSW